MHLVVADGVVPQVDVDAGAVPDLLFGSVAPDVDKLGACSRETSHFWSFTEDVSGTIKLLRAHPELAASHLTPAERAFISGYLCHLVTDEQWMLVIYRPFFGRRSRFGGSQEGVELQWALHMLLEQQLEVASARLPILIDRLANAGTAHLRPGLLPGVPMASFDAFRLQVLRQYAQPAGQERARLVAAGRDQVGAPRTPEQMAQHDRFIAHLPGLMARAGAYVPVDALAEFEARSRSESVAVVRDYLAGQPLRPPRGTAAPTSRVT